MPQLVREARNFSHLEHGVEMDESINLRACLLDPAPWALVDGTVTCQWPPLTLW